MVDVWASRLKMAEAAARESDLTVRLDSSNARRYPASIRLRNSREMVSKRIPKPSRKAGGLVKPPVPPPPPVPGDINWRFHHFNPRLQPDEIQWDLDAMLALAERYDELRAIAAERAAAEAEAAAVCGGSDVEAMETEAQGQQQTAAPLGAAKNAPPVVNSMQAGTRSLLGSPGAKPGLTAAVQQQAVQQVVA